MIRTPAVNLRNTLIIGKKPYFLLTGLIITKNYVKLRHTVLYLVGDGRLPILWLGRTAGGPHPRRCPFAAQRIPGDGRHGLVHQDLLVVHQGPHRADPVQV